MTLRLVSHPLPVSWDGRTVEWDRWALDPEVFICGRDGRQTARCECGSDLRPFTARGLRHPSDRMLQDHAALPSIMTPFTPRPTYDLRALRCPTCGQVDVWDMESDEWWTLDPTDYGPAGSNPPDWGTGGLLDMIGGNP